MKKLLLASLSLFIATTTWATNGVVATQVVSKDKIITFTVVDVGACYAETNSDTHTDAYTISFPISTREIGQTWLESGGYLVAGSFQSFDRIVTKDYTQRIPSNGAVWGTNYEMREKRCKEVRKSFVTNKELSEKLFKPQPIVID